MEGALLLRPQPLLRHAPRHLHGLRQQQGLRSSERFVSASCLTEAGRAEKAHEELSFFLQNV